MSEALAGATSISNVDRTILMLKAVHGKIDYNLVNYCAPCGYKLPKDMFRCPECGQKIRTRPWHRSKEVDDKRI